MYNLIKLETPLQNPNSFLLDRIKNQSVNTILYSIHIHDVRKQSKHSFFHSDSFSLKNNSIVGLFLKR